MSFQGAKSVTTAGTRVRLVAENDNPVARLCARVTITANSANTNPVFVGDAAVSSTAFGARLAADKSFTIGLGETGGNSVDLTTIYLDATTNGEGVKFFAEQL